MTIWVYFAISVVLNELFTLDNFTDLAPLTRGFIYIILSFSILLDLAVLYEYFKQKKK